MWAVSDCEERNLLKGLKSQQRIRVSALERSSIVAEKGQKMHFILDSVEMKWKEDDHGGARVCT